MSIDRLRRRKASERKSKKKNGLKEWFQEQRRKRKRRKSPGIILEIFKGGKLRSERKRERTRDVPRSKKREERRILINQQSNEIKTDAHEAKERKRKPDRQVLVEVLALYEQSDIAEDLKNMMKSWIIHHAEDETETMAYMDQFEERDLSIRELLERMGDLYLTQHPEWKKRIKELGSSHEAFLLDGMFDGLFQYAVNNPEYKYPPSKSAKAILDRLKDISSNYDPYV